MDVVGGEHRGDYLPIAEHGLIGDLHTVALVGDERDDRLVLLPARSTRPVCSDRSWTANRGGFFSLRPDGVEWAAKQLYFPDTNVLITRFLTESGVGEVQDFMPIERQGAMHRHRLIRRVVVVRGAMRFRLEVRPRFDYGREQHEIIVQEHGVVFASPSLCLALEGGLQSLQRDERRRARGLRARGGRGGGRSRSSAMPPDYVCRAVSRGRRPRRLFEATVGYWRRWLAQSRTAAAGARWSTARRSPSSCSPTRRPAPSWPRRRPACPSRSAACATGTTATRGSATPRSRSTRCCGSASREEAEAFMAC